MSDGSRDLTRMMLKRWRAMLRRCENPRDTSYPNYGGRGIEVCDSWHDFEAFLSDVGYPPAPGLSMDRIDNDGNYEPGNFRWATAREQGLNRRPARLKRVAQCGTNPGYARHRANGEPACDPCKKAHAASVLASRNRNIEAARERDRVVRLCPICGEGITRTNLRRHIRSKHNEDTPHTCQRCGSVNTAGIPEKCDGCGLRNWGME